METIQTAVNKPCTKVCYEVAQLSNVDTVLCGDDVFRKLLNTHIFTRHSNSATRMSAAGVYRSCVIVESFPTVFRVKSFLSSQQYE